MGFFEDNCEGYRPGLGDEPCDGEPEGDLVFRSQYTGREVSRLRACPRHTKAEQQRYMESAGEAYMTFERDLDEPQPDPEVPELDGSFKRLRETP